MKNPLFLVSILNFFLASAMEIPQQKYASAPHLSGGTVPRLRELAVQSLVQALIHNVGNTNLSDPEDIVDTLQTGRNLEEGIDNPTTSKLCSGIYAI